MKNAIRLGLAAVGVCVCLMQLPPLLAQAGLKLQGEKAQVEYLVIDQAERPTED